MITKSRLKVWILGRTREIWRKLSQWIVAETKSFGIFGWKRIHSTKQPSVLWLEIANTNAESCDEMSALVSASQQSSKIRSNVRLNEFSHHSVRTFQWTLTGTKSMLPKKNDNKIGWKFTLCLTWASKLYLSSFPRSGGTLRRLVSGGSSWPACPVLLKQKIIQSRGHHKSIKAKQSNAAHWIKESWRIKASF